MKEQANTELKTLRIQQVMDRFGFSRATIRNKLGRNPRRPNAFDPLFPKPVQLGARSPVFLESEIDQWVLNRAANRFSGPHPVAANGSDSLATKGSAE
jgi:predicted DNA-binding transcriptional regulator AlpA